MNGRIRTALPTLLVVASVATAPAASAGVTVTYAKGTLTVRTTAKSEELKIEPAGESVRILIDGHRADIPPEADTKVAAVRLIAGGGKDVFRIEAVRGELPTVTALGQGGKDTYVVDADMTGAVNITDDGSAASVLDLSRGTVPLKVNLGTGPGTTQRVTSDLRMRLAGWFKFVTAGAADDRLISSERKEQLTGGFGSDTFEFRGAFGADSITDFDDADTIRLGGGLSVRSGLGTSLLTIWDGTTDVGTVKALNDHLWQAEDIG